MYPEHEWEELTMPPILSQLENDLVNNAVDENLQYENQPFLSSKMDIVIDSSFDKETQSRYENGADRSPI